MSKKLKLFVFPIILSASLSITACSAEGIFGLLEDMIYGKEHIHTFSDIYTYDEESHWLKATCEHSDLTADFASHSFGEWERITEPTDSSTGLKKKTCSICGFSLEEIIPATSTFTVADYYNGYYSSIVSWENGEDLKNQLNILIRTGFNGLPYTGNWETNQYADQAIGDVENVDVVYSPSNELKTATYSGSSGWQREHAFCASLMTGYGTGEAVEVRTIKYSRATDFHNLFAAYSKGNQSRGNANFDELKDEQIREGGDYKSKGDVFEPGDYDKGRIARAIFYMGVMYKDDESSNISITITKPGGGSKAVTVPARYKGLKIVDKNVIYSRITFNNFISGTSNEAEALRAKYLTPLDKENPTEDEIYANYAKAYADYRYEECEFAIGNLSTLIKWNEFPVDELEYQHNESVYSHIYSKTKTAQNNRNPFVDYPELVDYVYGNKKNEAGVMNKLIPSQFTLKNK